MKKPAAAGRGQVYRPKKQAYPHQKKALVRMDGKKAFALLMAMRTGKTKVVLDDFGRLELAGLAEDLIVIAPAGVYRTWLTAMADHLSDDLESRIATQVWSAADREKKGKIRDRDAFLDCRDRPRCLLMNIEALSRAGSEARDFVVEMMLQGRKTYVAIDESTKIKNNSKRTKFVNSRIAPLALWRRIMSGLATPRAPTDLFFQFEFLDRDILGFHNWYAFRAHVAFMKKVQMHGRWIDLIDADKGSNGYRPEVIEELQETIEPHSFRVEFRPRTPSTYTIREVELTDDQRKAYDEIRDYATTELAGNKHVVSTVVIAQIMRMHQVLCGHVGDEEGGFHVLPENRTASLMELLEDYAGKAVIWASYDHDVRKITDALRAEYGDDSVARFWGGNTATREAEEKMFLTRPECRFQVATPDSGGMGRTWSVADLVVYYSSRDNLEHRDQSEMRVMGVDKERPVDFVDMIVPDTVEVKILHSLRNKINMAATINGDNYREWLI